jgi:hypothetical protein
MLLKLTAETLEQVTVLTEPEDKDFDIGVDRPQMTITVLKKGLPIAYNSITSLRLTIS